MYVARLGDGHVLKRMPNTGSRHAPDCPSYEPPAELSGLGQLMGSAIIEDPVSGVTSLKLGFAMSKLGARACERVIGENNGSVGTDGERLSLRGLLHYLWDQAALTRWQPGFAGKRSWATVRKHLLLAAEGKIARGRALHDRLFIPEIFSVEQRDHINARRLAAWAHATAASGGTRRLMLLIAELKEILPARYGCRAMLKHVPDQSLALDEKLFRRMERRFAGELSMWGASEGLHMIVAATFGVGDTGVPWIEELSLMPVNAQWIPIGDGFELLLVDRLVREGRRFTKCLPYNQASSQSMPTAVLLDSAPSPLALYVVRAVSANVDADHLIVEDDASSVAAWRWEIGQKGMPPLPRVNSVATRP